jgi:hypothetical protein
MITIFTTLKPLRGKFRIIQQNAVISWTKLKPRVNIILIGDEFGVADLARKIGAKHVSEVRKNVSGLPYLDSLFSIVKKKSKDEIFAYLNSDIILFDDFIKAIRIIAQDKNRFLMVGRRTDLDINKPINFNNQKDVRELIYNARRNGRLHDYHGLDYFVYPRNFWRRVPSFTVGRSMVDNWLVYEARRITSNVIDATEAVLSIHQNHDYSTVPGVGTGITSRVGPVFERESNHNFRLTKGRFGNAKDVKYLLTKNFVLKKYNRFLDFEKMSVDLRNCLKHYFKMISVFAC